MDWKLEELSCRSPTSTGPRSSISGSSGSISMPTPTHTGDAGGAHDAARVGLLNRDRPRTDQRGRPRGAAAARFQLVVSDLGAARTELTGRGVEVSEIQQLDPRDGGKLIFLADLDGNQRAVQEIRERIGAPLD